VAPRTSAGGARRLLIVVWPIVVLGVAAGGSTELRVAPAVAGSVPSPATSRARETTTRADDDAPRAAAPIASSSRPRRVTLAFTGDILIHQRLWETARAHAGGVGFDFRPMFAPLRPVLSRADVAICHLETPLSPDDADLASYPIFETPHELAPAIAWAGYDGCSTASNHSLDGGPEGVEATLRWLDRSDLGHAGTARSPRERDRLTIYEVDGADVAHLSYTWSFNGFTPDVPWRANVIDVPRVLRDAERADRRADLVIVSVHWGVEYTHTPTAWQIEVADRLARAGTIDLIVGHHAHVVQPLARIDRTWVAYGLGNILSGMTSSLGTPAVQDGVVLLAEAVRRGERWRIARLSVVPTSVEYGTWRILPIRRTLVHERPTAALRTELLASEERTLSALAALGVAETVDSGPEPLRHLGTRGVLLVLEVTEDVRARRERRRDPSGPRGQLLV
jgi:poly-gamma-glutamate synthesis protein (capsule biosynthesis protein)